MIPKISISGNGPARGRQYNEGARDQIRLSLNIYHEVFQYYAQWNWETVLNHTQKYIDPISNFDSKLIDELHGIAEGANVRSEEILAINTRTEIMFAAKVRDIAAKLPPFLECTSSVQSRENEDILIAQNWAWLTSCSESVVLVQADLGNGIKYVTGVEAGL